MKHASLFVSPVDVGLWIYACLSQSISNISRNYRRLEEERQRSNDSANWGTRSDDRGPAHTWTLSPPGLSTSYFVSGYLHSNLLHDQGQLSSLACTAGLLVFYPGNQIVVAHLHNVWYSPCGIRELWLRPARQVWRRFRRAWSIHMLNMNASMRENTSRKVRERPRQRYYIVLTIQFTCCRPSRHKILKLLCRAGQSRTSKQTAAVQWEPASDTANFGRSMNN
jgi:hypothetical protein